MIQNSESANVIECTAFSFSAIKLVNTKHQPSPTTNLQARNTLLDSRPWWPSTVLHVPITGIYLLD